MAAQRLFVASLFGLFSVCILHAADETIAAPLKSLAEMDKANTLFSKESYKSVRGHCVKLFEDRHQEQIKSCFGTDNEDMMTWFEKHKEIKEEFYSAIDEKNDKIDGAFRVFHDLWKKNPEAVAKYSNLAIAFAVVWDDPRHVYDYQQHQTRTRSFLPDDSGKIGPDIYFQDLIDRQKDLQNKEPMNRLLVMPWEFLIYVVDHHTPLEERKWASKQYLPKRTMIGKIYEDVPYDLEMLRTQGKSCKLGGKPYTLDSVLKNGGVCSMQADFAARVGKSVLVPAAYIHGESQFQELHAWVMWVEVHSAAAQINFTLESHGRYLYDNYYTGKLADPQTGEEILDRDMERRLAAVARDRVGKRHAELIMGHYDEICMLREFDQKKKIFFLDRCLALSPYNESAWLELSRQVRQGEVDAEAKQIVLTHVDLMLKSFAKYPDFSWKIANDLILIQNNKLARNQFYSRLCAVYEAAARPDLACEARLKWVDFQIEDAKWQLAAQGLAYTIQKFPAEGRYVPKMVNMLKDVCGKYKGGSEYFGTQMNELIKKIPPKRGDTPNKFCVQMYELAIAFFKDNKKPKLAKDLETQLKSVTSTQ